MKPTAILLAVQIILCTPYQQNVGPTTCNSGSAGMLHSNAAVVGNLRQAINATKHSFKHNYSMTVIVSSNRKAS